MGNDIKRTLLLVRILLRATIGFLLIWTSLALCSEYFYLTTIKASTTNESNNYLEINTIEDLRQTINLNNSNYYSSVSFSTPDSYVDLQKNSNNEIQLRAINGIDGNKKITLVAQVDGVSGKLSTSYVLDVSVKIKNLVINAPQSIDSWNTTQINNLNSTSKKLLSANWDNQTIATKKDTDQLYYSVTQGWEYVENIKAGTTEIHDSYLKIKPGILASHVIKIKAIYEQSGITHQSQIETIKIINPIESLNLIDVNRALTEEVIEFVQQTKTYRYNERIVPYYYSDGISYTLEGGPGLFGNLVMSNSVLSLTISADAPLNIKFGLNIFANGKLYRVMKFVVEEVYSTEISLHLRNANNVAIVTEKVMPNEQITTVINYVPANTSILHQTTVLSFSSSMTVTENSFASLHDNRLIINPFINIRANEPKFTIYATTRGANDQIIQVSQEIKIFVPIMSVKSNIEDLYRGEDNKIEFFYNSGLNLKDTNYSATNNGGYINPSAKGIKSTTLTIQTWVGNTPQSGATFGYSDFKIYLSPDFCYGSILKLSVTAIDNQTFEILFGVRKMVTSDLEYHYSNNPYAELGSEYIDKDEMGRYLPSFGTIDLLVDSDIYLLIFYRGKQISFKYYNLEFTDITISYIIHDVSQKTINNSLYDTPRFKLKENIKVSSFLYTVVITDGSEIIKRDKPIHPYKSIYTASLNTTTITNVKTELSVISFEGSSISGTFKFKKVTTNDKFQLSNEGQLQVLDKTLNGLDITIGISCIEKYNGVDYEVSYAAECLVVSLRISLSLSETLYFQGKSSTLVNDDGRVIAPNGYVPITLELKRLRDLGYTTIDFTIYVTIAEIDDCYQQLFIWDINYNILYQNTKIEHGAGVKNQTQQSIVLHFRLIL